MLAYVRFRDASCLHTEVHDAKTWIETRSENVGNSRVLYQDDLGVQFKTSRAVLHVQTNTG